MMSFYLRVINRKTDKDEYYSYSTLSEAIEAMESLEFGTFISLTTRKPKKVKIED